MAPLRCKIVIQALAHQDQLTPKRRLACTEVVAKHGGVVCDLTMMESERSPTPGALIVDFPESLTDEEIIRRRGSIQADCVQVLARFPIQHNGQWKYDVFDFESPHLVNGNVEQHRICVDIAEDAGALLVEFAPIHGPTGNIHGHLRVVYEEGVSEDERQRRKARIQRECQSALRKLATRQAPTHIVPAPQATIVRSEVTMPDSKVKIFISHSHDDAELVRSLVFFIRNCINLPKDAIRCTSMDGHDLGIGDPTTETIREELLSADVLVAVVTPDSLKSTWVLFELGARWSLKKYLVPLLHPALGFSSLPGPIRDLNAAMLSDWKKMLKVSDGIAKALGVPIDDTTSAAVAAHEFAARVAELMKAPNASVAGAALVDHPREMGNTTAPAPDLYAPRSVLVGALQFVGEVPVSNRPPAAVRFSHAHRVNFKVVVRDVQGKIDHSGGFRLALTITNDGPAKLKNIRASIIGYTEMNSGHGARPYAGADVHKRGSGRQRFEVLVYPLVPAQPALAAALARHEETSLTISGGFVSFSLPKARWWGGALVIQADDVPDSWLQMVVRCPNNGNVELWLLPVRGDKPLVVHHAQELNEWIPPLDWFEWSEKDSTIALKPFVDEPED